MTLIRAKARQYNVNPVNYNCSGVVPKPNVTKPLPGVVRTALLKLKELTLLADDHARECFIPRDWYTEIEFNSEKHCSRVDFLRIHFATLRYWGGRDHELMRRHI